MPFPADAATVYNFEPLQARTVGGQDALAAALAEADAIREAARAEGAAQARIDAEQAVRAEVQETLSLIGAAHGALAQLTAEYVAALRGDAVALGLRLAEQIVAGAIDVTPERLVDIAELTLRRLADRRSVTLVVNPAELEVLSAAVEQLRAQLGGIEQLSVQADRRVGRGGVVARTDEGEIDATVEAQLARAREVVTDELKRSVA